METIKFDIQPWQGALPLRFGMKQAEVEGLLGISKRTDVDEGECSEYRYEGSLTTTYKKLTEDLYHIGFANGIYTVFFEQINIFEASPETVIRALMVVDDQPYEYLGFLVFFKLGITLTGFHDDNEDDKTFVVTNDLRLFEERIAKMSPYIPDFD